MKKTIEIPYETHDLYLASYLLTVGIPMANASRKGPHNSRTVTFEFGDPERCRTLSRAWLMGTDEHVQASKYAESVKRLKNLALNGGVL